MHPNGRNYIVLIWRQKYYIFLQSSEEEKEKINLTKSHNAQGDILDDKEYIFYEVVMFYQTQLTQQRNAT